MSICAIILLFINPKVKRIKKIVKYLDSLPASLAGKSEKSPENPSLAIRNRKGIETVGKVGFEWCV